MTDRPVVLVTGARSGIGRHLAEHLARTGYLVEGCSRTPLDIPLQGVTCHLADVTSEDEVRALVRAIGDRHGRLDAVVNNAGIASMNHALLTPASTVDRIFDVNVRGTFIVCREAARLMQRHRTGRIVNLSSVAVPMQLEGEAVYAASKAAVEMLTKILARELAPFGITVNAVGPGPIDTDLLRGVPAEAIQRVVDRLAVKRMNRPEEVAHVIDFFLHPDSDSVTGQVIYLGGPG